MTPGRILRTHDLFWLGNKKSLRSENFLKTIQSLKSTCFFMGNIAAFINGMHSLFNLRVPELRDKSIASALQSCYLPVCYCTLGTLHCSVARVSFWFSFKYSSWSLQRTHWNCTDAESLFAFDFAMADLTVLENINIDSCWNEIWFSSKCGNFEAKQVGAMKV